MINSDILSIAMNVMQIETEALIKGAERLGGEFEQAVNIIVNTKGRVVCCGVGKSGNIARKLVGTLSSTGTPSLFLHPAEAVHGELGAVTYGDVVLLFTNSGETDELIAIIPALKRIGVTFIGFTGNPNSTIGQACDVVINSHVDREACPMNLAPTSSAVLQLALGDALAITVMSVRKFSPSDYAQFHPSGTLGRKLLLHVYDVMRKGEQVAVVNSELLLRETLFEITKAGAGSACVVDAEGKLIGFITDGDIRRALMKDDQALKTAVSAFMNGPKYVIKGNPLAVEALGEMTKSGSPKIGEMPVLDSDGKPIGLIMLKDLLRSGII